MNKTLNEQQILDISEAYSLVDDDNDGFINKKDIPNVFAHFDESLKLFVIKDEELKDSIDRIDSNDSDQISFVQFLTLIANKINTNNTFEELQAAFRMFDRKNAGFITIDDLWAVMEHLDENLSKSDMEQMMLEADRDSDGRISFAEFIETIRYK